MSTHQIRVEMPLSPVKGTVDLPSSKSISNRALVIRSLCKDSFTLSALSDADDTTVLEKLLRQTGPVDDAGAGGTTFRFLLALRAFQQHQGVITGTLRLQERPVGILVDTLRDMGARMDYLQRDGYPPLQLNGGALCGGAYTLDGSVSSQFVSALMLIGPCLAGGLVLERSGRMVSSSYVEMTAALMRRFGVEVIINDRVIVVPEAAYVAKDYTVEADWSAAVFFYAMAALLPGSSMLLNRLSLSDIQADARLAVWMEEWGVRSVQEEGGVRISSSGIPDREFEYDFLNNPDLAQAFAVMAAVSGKPVSITGLSTLRDKETDRLMALKTELSAAGAVVEISDDSLAVSGSVKAECIAGHVFPSYHDHRMVMALSLLACTGTPVLLQNPEHVSKSFPGYFEMLKKLKAKIS